MLHGPNNWNFFRQYQKVRWKRCNIITIHYLFIKLYIGQIIPEQIRKSCSHRSKRWNAQRTKANGIESCWSGQRNTLHGLLLYFDHMQKKWQCIFFLQKKPRADAPNYQMNRKWRGYPSLSRFLVANTLHQNSKHTGSWFIKNICVVSFKSHASQMLRSLFIIDSMTNFVQPLTDLSKKKEIHIFCLKIKKYK